MFLSVKRNEKYLNNYIIFMFIFSTIAILYRFYMGSYSVNYIDFLFEGDFSKNLNRFKDIISSNLDIFTNSPLKNSISSQSIESIGSRTITTTVNEFSQVYDLLFYHPSWILNSVLVFIISTSPFNQIIIGALVSTTIYNNGKTKSNNYINIIKEQLLATIGYSIFLLIVVSILGMVVGYFKYITQIQNYDNIDLILKLYDEFDIWTPNLSYYLRAIIGALISLITYGIFGLFIGNIIKDKVLSLLSIFVMSNYLYTFMVKYPLAPTYFLARLLDKFIFTTQGIISIPSNILFTSIIFIIFLAIIIIISALSIKDYYNPINEKIEVEI